MNPEQRHRYSRQISVPRFGETGQQKLLDARVLIVGLGGLGSPAALYLAASGVGTLVLNDFDIVDITNLQRQIIHRQIDIGQSKVDSARRTILEINPQCHIITKEWQLDDQELNTEVSKADLVLDCSDNFTTKYALNFACMNMATALITGAAIREEGQIFVTLGKQGPCYNCLYPNLPETYEDCSTQGILAPLVGTIGSLQALQALQILNGNKITHGQLTLFNATTMQWRSIKVPQDPACIVCANLS